MTAFSPAPVHFHGMNILLLNEVHEEVKTNDDVLLLDVSNQSLGFVVGQIGGYKNRIIL